MLGEAYVEDGQYPATIVRSVMFFVTCYADEERVHELSVAEIRKIMDESMECARRTERRRAAAAAVALASKHAPIVKNG